MNMYDRGAIFGLDAYLRKYAAVDSFGTPDLVGTLSACREDDEWNRGCLHGLALGAHIQWERMSRTLELSRS